MHVLQILGVGAHANSWHSWMGIGRFSYIVMENIVFLLIFALLYVCTVSVDFCLMYFRKTGLKCQNLVSIRGACCISKECLSGHLWKTWRRASWKTCALYACHLFLCWIRLRLRSGSHFRIACLEAEKVD